MYYRLSLCNRLVRKKLQNQQKKVESGKENISTSFWMLSALKAGQNTQQLRTKFLAVNLTWG